MLGPCPRCRRHIDVAAHCCPFCHAKFTMSRRDLGKITAAAAITLGFGPIADAARDPWMQEQDYGLRRPEPEIPAPSPVDVVYGDWLSEVGVINGADSWAGHKPGTAVSYTSTDGRQAARVTATLTLMKVADAAITLKVAVPGKAAEEKVFARGDGISKDAKVVEEGKETLEINGVKYECEAKSYELPGRTFKVWWCKQAPLGFAKVTCGDETIRLAKASEKLKLRWGEHECSVWETSFGDSVRKTWRSTKVPGQVVKIEETSKKAGLSLAVEVAAYTEGK